MTRPTLITGGAGFIGAHVARRLLAAGRPVRVLDALHPQVHGGAGRPDYLPPDVDLLVGDVRDPDTVERALDGITDVVHLAARVGVGQSMTDMVEYSDTNVVGTATLLSRLTASDVERLVVASSMSVYGEGSYTTRDGTRVIAPSRQMSDLARSWEPTDSRGTPLRPVPTPETQPPSPASLYATDKLYQEQACLVFGRATQMHVTALRLFNVFGPFQALSNPYTGVIVNLAVRILNGQRPVVFEDGNQRRDFVYVDDVARAFALALERTPGPCAPHLFNVGSGDSITVGSVARLLATLLERPDLIPDITHEYRSGDIRHCFADTALASRELGFTAEVTLAEGLNRLIPWLRENSRAQDKIAAMRASLDERGLLRRR